MRGIGALGRSREVPGDACPYCGYHFEMATQVGGDGRPEVGDATRLQALWDVSDNHHHWTALRTAAKEIGYMLQGSPGNKRQPAKETP